MGRDHSPHNSRRRRSRSNSSDRDSRRRRRRSESDDRRRRRRKRSYSPDDRNARRGRDDRRDQDRDRRSRNKHDKKRREKERDEKNAEEEVDDDEMGEIEAFLMMEDGESEDVKQDSGNKGRERRTFRTVEEREDDFQKVNFSPETKHEEDDEEEYVRRRDRRRRGSFSDNIEPSDHLPKEVVEGSSKKILEGLQVGEFDMFSNSPSDLDFSNDQENRPNNQQGENGIDVAVRGENVQSNWDDSEGYYKAGFRDVFYLFIDFV